MRGKLQKTIVMGLHQSNVNFLCVLAFVVAAETSATIVAVEGSMKEGELSPKMISYPRYYHSDNRLNMYMNIFNI